MAKNTNTRLTTSKKVDRREAKEAEKELKLEDDLQPSLRFVHEQYGEMALFFNGTFGLCFKSSVEDELQVFNRTQPAMICEFGDPAKVLAGAIAGALDLLSESAGRDLALHMLKAHIDLLTEKHALKDKVARKTLRKYKMSLSGEYAKA
jgi:hypothetical protein